MSDSIEILEATLAGSEKAVRDRDNEIAALKIRLSERDRTIQDMRNMYIRTDAAVQAVSLRDQEVDLPKFIDRVATLESALSDVAKENNDRVDRICELTEEIEQCDRKIEILEDNLSRARSEHLEQLRAIIQMLEPLATHEDKGTIYLSHFGKAAMVYLIQRVIYANIKKLDPKLSTYSNDF